VSAAQRLGARVVASSYNEPLITSEWAVEVFKLAKPQGFLTAYISNGNGTREVLEYIRPWVDCYKIDLKSMSAKGYRELGGKVENVLETVKMVHDLGFWMEIVTLVVPGFNDSDEELREAARFLAGISPDIPWHVTAFHKDYKMTDPENTGPRTLLRAAEIGRQEGLRYVYAGNLPGQVGESENTYCPNCRALLVGRYGYTILEYRVTLQGACPDCGARIPGVWWDDQRPRQLADRPTPLTHRV
jgi:pyruvate formate lyase activating enzyme